MQNNQAIPFNKENFKQIFSFQFISVIIVSIPSALVADYFNVPLAWFLGPMLITALAAFGNRTQGNCLEGSYVTTTPLDLIYT